MAKPAKRVAKKATTKKKLAKKTSVRKSAKAKKFVTSPERATIISFILDETGSMGARKEATIAGFNEYVETLNKNGAKIIFTLTKFNSGKTEIVHKGVGLDKVSKLTNENYRPTNGTPLFDAVGRTIQAVDEEVSAFPLDLKPAVLVVIMTDGEENASVEFNNKRIVDMIRARESLGWDFVYLGADHNAFKAAQSIGINLGLNNVAQYSQVNVVGVFTASANAHTRYASNVTRGLDNTRDHLFTSGETTVLCSTQALDKSTVQNLVGSTSGDLPAGTTSK